MSAKLFRALAAPRLDGNIAASAAARLLAPLETRALRTLAPRLEAAAFLAFAALETIGARPIASLGAIRVRPFAALGTVCLRPFAALGAVAPRTIERPALAAFLAAKTFTTFATILKAARTGFVARAA